MSKLGLSCGDFGLLSFKLVRNLLVLCLSCCDSTQNCVLILLSIFGGCLHRLLLGLRISSCGLSGCQSRLGSGDFFVCILCSDICE